MLPSAGDPRFHRTDGDVEDGRDLRVVEVADVAHHDGGAEVVVDVVERLVEGESVGDGVDAARAQLVDGFGWPAVVVLVDDVERRSSLALAEFVERGVGRDPVGPGAECGPPVEGRQRADDLDEGFLAGVVGVPRGAGDTSGDGVDPVVVPSEQLVEREPIAPLRSLDQLEIVGLDSDVPTVPTGVTAGG